MSKSNLFIKKNKIFIWKGHHKQSQSGVATAGTQDNLGGKGLQETTQSNFPLKTESPVSSDQIAHGFIHEHVSEQINWLVQSHRFNIH